MVIKEKKVKEEEDLDIERMYRATQKMISKNYKGCSHEGVVLTEVNKISCWWALVWEKNKIQKLVCRYCGRRLG